MLPATPRLAGGLDLGVGWIQPVSYWREGAARDIPQPPRAWLRDGLLIAGGNGIDALQALSPDGAVVWRYPTEFSWGESATFVGPWAVSNGVAALDLGQELVALRLDDGQAIWRLDTQYRMPLVAATGDTLYLRDFTSFPSQLLAIEPSTGDERWRYDCLGDLYDPVLASPASLFAVCQDSAGLIAIAELSAQTGELVRMHPVPARPAALLGYEQDVLLLAMAEAGGSPYELSSGSEYQLTALDWPTGNLLWQAYLSSLDAVKIDGDGVLIASGNQLQRRSLRAGQPLWVTTLPVDDHKLRVAQALADGETLLIGSDSGFLYALGLPGGELLWLQDLWGMLDETWRPVIPLGVDGDAILVWMGAKEGNAVASLQPGASLAAWPTPTFLPDAAFAIPAPTPTPSASKTPPPADWTPEPVKWIPSHFWEFPSAEPEMEDLLLAWLNLHPGDYDGFNKQVSQWPPIHDPEVDAPAPYPSDYVSWVQRLDLDGDGDLEDIVAYGLRLKTWAVLETDSQGTRVVYFRRPEDPSYNGTPEFILADDINCDGQVEVVVQWAVSTTNGDHSHAVIGQWDGVGWRSLGDVYSSGLFGDPVRTPEINFVDTDGDGCLEAVARVYPIMMSPARPQTWIYAFHDEGYRHDETQADPSHLGYFKAIDANHALERGDLDQALQLATQALQDPETGMSSWGGIADVSPYEARIAALAAAEAMLVHALRGQPEAMQSLLQQAEDNYARPDNPFLPAARALWETYAATDDLLTACQAMERVVRLWGDALLVPLGAERLEIEQICPLD